MDNAYTSISGITEEEMRTQMKSEIEEFAKSIEVTFDQACASLKQKYDGYHFAKKSPDIYNPFSLMIPYSATLAKNGTPKKLVKTGANFDKEKRTLGEWKIVE